MRLLEDRVLLKPHKFEKASVIINPWDDEFIKTWKVLEIGPWVEEVSPGDIIYANSNSVIDLNDQEGKVIINEYQILAKCIL